jgi:putative peptidoglycan lipid II flippase
MLKDMALADRFGTSDAMDAYLIALVVPMMAVNVIGASIPPALVPTFIERGRQGGRAAAQRLLSAAVGAALVLTLITQLLVAIGADVTIGLIGQGFSPEKGEVARSLTILISPIIVLGGLSHLLSGILNTEGRFALPAILPALTPVSILLAIGFLEPALGIQAVVLGLVAGWFLRVVVLLIALVRRGYRPVPTFGSWPEGMGQVAGQYLPVVAGSVLMAGTTVVDQAMAAPLGTGAVSALSYGSKVVAFFLGAGGMAIGTVVLPHFSGLVESGDWKGIRATLSRLRRLILLATVPAVLLVVALSEPISALLFERGAFTSDDTALVSRVQTFYVLQVPFYLLGIMLVRLISSVRANHILTIGSAISLVLNIGLNLVFIEFFGVAGIALSTSAVYLVALVFLTLMLRRYMLRLEAGSAPM